MNDDERFLTITRVLRDQYDTFKYDARFTPWGVAYFWNSAREGFDSAKSPLWPAIITVFADARLRNRHVRQHESAIPKARGEYAHYGVRCLMNRDLVTDTFVRYVGEETKEITDILDDTRLLREALTQYVADHDAKRVPPTTDIFEYLLHTVPSKPFEQRPEPAGVYRHLLERLVLRYDRHMLENTLELAQLPRAGVLHQEAIDARKIKIPQELVDAYHAQVPSADNNTPLEADPGIVSLHSMLGKRRVKLSGGTGALIDWGEFMEEHLRRRNLFVSLNPVAVMRSRLTNNVTTEYLALAKEQGLEAAVRSAEDAAKTCTNSEQQQALYTTAKLLHLMGSFAHADGINRTMRIVRKE